MSLGACLVSNEPAGLKDLLIQARIDGKSWQQIADEFNFGSPSGARNAFKKITGITDFKIKGKELKAILDNGMVDDLKKAVPKKPKVQPIKEAAEEVAPATAEAVKAADTFVSSTPGVSPGSLADKIMQQKLPGKSYLADSNSTSTFSLHWNESIRLKAGKAVNDLPINSQTLTNIITDLKSGTYYQTIVNKYGVTFADVDTINWYLKMHDLSLSAQNIWLAYTQKVTSQTGLDAVKDMVWAMRKLGADVGDIATATGVPKNVVELIVKNEWKLPAPGSSTYVGFTSPSYTPSSQYSYQQTSSQLIGESNSFKDMTKGQADAWVDMLGKDLTPAQFQQLQAYTGSWYSTVNTTLRNGNYVDSDMARRIGHVDDAMAPIPYNVTLRRGVGSNTFPGGVPSVGDAFTDAGYMSTSYGGSAGFSGRPYTLVIDAPAGTMARPLHQLSSFKSEREILLARGTKFVVTGVRHTGSTTEVYLKVVLP